MVHFGSTNVKKDDVKDSHSFSIEKLTIDNSILISAIRSSRQPDMNDENDINLLFEAICTELEEEGGTVYDIVEIHVHINDSVKRDFLKKYYEFFVEKVPRLVLMTSEKQGISQVRVAAHHGRRSPRIKTNIKEVAKLLVISSLLGIAIGAVLLGGIYYLLLRYD
ncbi:hypothetical protein M3650_28345 [Paenibacillus sp. MER TA 81-3]|uniref:hypothetical protein n=1 Tax=Paenibacillus sp. MER TA 81-3 TaxID=2939573 RepID=UPI002042089F|nr:hypothetical protein [Paenibacillus sp. MER TA 81-3]MCM3342431.1 hypothetical protein [Paenibacillus sp. MER TA 81-3]